MTSTFLGNKWPNIYNWKRSTCRKRQINAILHLIKWKSFYIIAYTSLGLPHAELKDTGKYMLFLPVLKHQLPIVPSLLTFLFNFYGQSFEDHPCKSVLGNVTNPQLPTTVFADSVKLFFTIAILSVNINPSKRCFNSPLSTIDFTRCWQDIFIGTVLVCLGWYKLVP